jgi:hypothetical protein
MGMPVPTLRASTEWEKGLVERGRGVEEGNVLSSIRQKSLGMRSPRWPTMTLSFGNRLSDVVRLQIRTGWWRVLTRKLHLHKDQRCGLIASQRIDAVRLLPKESVHNPTP